MASVLLEENLEITRKLCNNLSVFYFEVIVNELIQLVKFLLVYEVPATDYSRVGVETER